MKDLNLIKAGVPKNQVFNEDRFLKNLTVGRMKIKKHERDIE